MTLTNNAHYMAVLPSYRVECMIPLCEGDELPVRIVLTVHREQDLEALVRVLVSNRLDEIVIRKNEVFG